MASDVAADSLNTQGIQYIPHTHFNTIDFDAIAFHKPDVYSTLLENFEEIFKDGPTGFDATDAAMMRTHKAIRENNSIAYLNCIEWKKYQGTDQGHHRPKKGVLGSVTNPNEQYDPMVMALWTTHLVQMLGGDTKTTQAITKQKIWFRVDANRKLEEARFAPNPPKDPVELATRHEQWIQRRQQQKEDQARVAREVRSIVRDEMGKGATQEPSNLTGDLTMMSPEKSAGAATTTDTAQNDQGRLLSDAVVRIINGQLIVEYNGERYSAPDTAFRKEGAAVTQKGTDNFPTHLQAGPVKIENSGGATGLEGLGTGPPRVNTTAVAGGGGNQLLGSTQAGNTSTTGGSGGGTTAGANAGSGGNATSGGGSSSGASSNPPPGSNSGGPGDGSRRFVTQPSATSVIVHTQSEPTILPFVTPENPMDREDKMKEYLKNARRDFEFHGISDPRKMKAGLVLKGGDQIQTIEQNGYRPREGLYAINIMDNEYDALEKTILHHFCHQANELYRRHRFRALRPRPQEVVGAFHLRLEEAAHKCDFPQMEKEKQILNQLIDHWPDKSVNERALTENWNLKRYLEKAAARQHTKYQMNEMGMKSTSSREVVDVFQVKREDGGYCGKCGKPSHPRDECPARGDRCYRCDSLNHWAVTCSVPARMSYPPRENRYQDRYPRMQQKERQSGYRYDKEHRHRSSGGRMNQPEYRRKPSTERMDQRYRRKEGVQRKYEERGKDDRKENGKERSGKDYGKKKDHRHEKRRNDKYGFKKKGKRFVRKLDEEEHVDGATGGPSGQSGSESDREYTDTDTDTETSSDDSGSQSE